MYVPYILEAKNFPPKRLCTMYLCLKHEIKNLFSTFTLSWDHCSFSLISQSEVLKSHQTSAVYLIMQPPCHILCNELSLFGP